MVNDGHTTASGRIDSRLNSSGWAMCLMAKGRGLVCGYLCSYKKTASGVGWIALGEPCVWQWGDT